MASPAGFHVVAADETNAPPTSYPTNTRIMIGGIVAVFLVIVLVLVINVYARWFLQLSSHSYAVRRGIASVSPTAASSAHINSTGVDKAVIAQMPTFVYKSWHTVDVDVEVGAAAVDGPPAAKPPLECVVCIAEFQDDDKCRMLPACKHIFHTDCIDKWFSSHSTCPLCRTAVRQAMEPLHEAAPAADEHHHGGETQEAMGALPTAATASTQGNPVAPNMVEHPCDALSQGNQTQVIASQEAASSTKAMSGSLRRSGAGSLPQISIDIPPIVGIYTLAGASGPLSGKHATAEQEAAGSSQLLKSPSLRASIRRMLSRQSSRHRSFSQEGNEELAE